MHKLQKRVHIKGGGHSIPLACREKFRFKDAKGDLFEMNVMPMGHRCAPETMHVLTATLAGDKQFCTADAAFSSDNADVYIDGIRFAGSEVIAEQYVRFVDNRAREVNARFKDAGAPPSQTYTFNGITYHHGLGKVSLGPKLTRRLTQDDFATVWFFGVSGGSNDFCVSGDGYAFTTVSSRIKNCTP